MERGSVNEIVKRLQASTDARSALEREQTQLENELKEAQQSDVDALRSRLREVETKMRLENDRYEELMIDLALGKKGEQQTVDNRDSGIELGPGSAVNTTTATASATTTTTTVMPVMTTMSLTMATNTTSGVGTTTTASSLSRLDMKNEVLRPPLLPTLPTAGETSTLESSIIRPSGAKSVDELSHLNSIVSSPSLDPYLLSLNNANRLANILPSGQRIPNYLDNPLTIDPLLYNTNATHPQSLQDPYLRALSANLMLELDSGLDMALGSVDADNRVDMLDIPGKGRCFVYLARYSYDPFQQSLNENPETELPLQSGDYLLVWSDSDEDGYVEGELLDGRRGPVPSNFIERLSGDDLLEFHRAVVLAAGDDLDQTTNNPAVTAVDDVADLKLHNVHQLQNDSPERDVPLTYEEERHLLNATYLSPEDEALEANPSSMPGSHFYPSTSVMTTSQHHKQHSNESPPPAEATGSSVPSPRNLTLERQLNKSILISWTAPSAEATQHALFGSHIEMYHVYVDGFLRTTVRSTDKTKALVEGVDNIRPHRISVRSVLSNRKTSKDAACTMIIGRDAPLGPSCVRASHITSSAAVISWLPSNSNFQHTVCINSVEVRTVKAGVFRHAITGLTANTHYRVTVRAKNIKASPFADEKSLAKLLEKLSAHTEFSTLKKALPDPPMDVRVDGGPQDGTLLVTWIPVPLNASQTNRLAPVTGYAVFADGKRVTDVDSPTSDHALIDLGCIGHFNPKLVTVRSKCGDLLSNDSTAVTVHNQNKAARKGGKAITSGFGARFGSGQGGGGGRMGGGGHRLTGSRRGDHVDLEDNLSDKEMYARNVPAIEITRESPSELDQVSDDEYDDYGRRRFSQGQVGSRGQRRRSHPNNRHMGRRSEDARVFVALFDYDPPTMSPNPEACDDELAFREGQLIRIIGEKDADGFYWGESNGVSGYVPCNMVSEVQVEDERFVHDLSKDQGHMQRRRSRANAAVSQTSTTRLDRWNEATLMGAPVRKMVALYDYDPQELSPNVDAEVELSFRTGDLIYVYGDIDDDGFYFAELRGLRGLVPSNFLTDATPHVGANNGHHEVMAGVNNGRRAAMAMGQQQQVGQHHQQQGQLVQQQQQQQQQPQQLQGAVYGGPVGGRVGAPMGPGAAGPPPPPREQRTMSRENLNRADLNAAVKASMAAQQQVAPGAVYNQMNGSGSRRASAAPPVVAPSVSIDKPVDLDRIPGLDDFDDPTAAQTAHMGASGALGPPAPGAGARRPSRVGEGLRPGVGGAAGGRAAEGEGGLLGAVTGGLSGLTSGGLGKLGDLAGTASNAGGGLLSSGKGLFKKFGF